MKLKTISFAVILVAAIAIFVSCTKKLTNDVTPSQTTLNASGTSLDAVSNLGRVMFYDTHLSVNNSIACASCHKQAFAFSDNVAVSAGFENQSGTRNALPIHNLSNFSILFWDARDTSLSSMVFMPVLNHAEMGMNDISDLITRVSSLSYYTDLFNKAYGVPNVTAQGISDALSSFVQKISSSGSRFDAYLHGQGSLTPVELNGMNLFEGKYNCNSCHQVNEGGQYENSAQFANIGLDVNYSDIGLAAITNQATDNGKFKVPNLRNVALTAPYMHDGRFATLDQVLDHYSSGIANNPYLDWRLRVNSKQPLRMNITADDRTALIAFLNTLTDYTVVTNPDLSSPFKQ